MVRVERRERAIEDVLVEHAPEGIGTRRVGRVHRETADAAAAQAGAAHVHDDPVEPGVQTCWFAQVGPVEPGLDRGVVHGVLGIRAVPQDHAGQVIGAFEPALRELLERRPSLGLGPPGRDRAHVDQSLQTLDGHHTHKMRQRAVWFTSTVGDFP